MRTPLRFFYLPKGTTEKVTKVAKTEHKVREPAMTIDMIPELVKHTLPSSGKFLILTTYPSTLEIN